MATPGGLIPAFRANPPQSLLGEPAPKPSEHASRSNRSTVEPEYAPGRWTDQR